MSNKDIEEGEVVFLKSVPANELRRRPRGNTPKGFFWEGTKDLGKWVPGKRRSAGCPPKNHYWAGTRKSGAWRLIDLSGPHSEDLSSDVESTLDVITNEGLAKLDEGDYDDEEDEDDADEDDAAEDIVSTALNDNINANMNASGNDNANTEANIRLQLEPHYDYYVDSVKSIVDAGFPQTKPAALAKIIKALGGLEELRGAHVGEIGGGFGHLGYQVLKAGQPASITFLELEDFVMNTVLTAQVSACQERTV